MFKNRAYTYLQVAARSNWITSKRKISEFVTYEQHDSLAIISIIRPDQRNAIDDRISDDLGEALNRFNNDDGVDVGVLYGVGGSFSSGTDLTTCNTESIGPTWSRNVKTLSKPMVCGVSGYCVGSGLELALLCDLRVVEENAILGFFNRRFGVPLMDGATQRLVSLIGLSRSLDLVLTGRVLSGKEAFDIGLSNRLVAPGTALGQAVTVAKCIGKFPMSALKYDRKALYRAAFSNISFDTQQPIPQQLLTEMEYGINVFKAGVGRRGKTQDIKKNTMADWEVAEYNIELMKNKTES